MTVYVWRVEVTQWPGDGEPWEPAYGWVTHFSRPDDPLHFAHPIPDWVTTLVERALEKSETTHDHSEVAWRTFRSVGPSGEKRLGVVMPPTTRKNWLSAGAAQKQANLIRAFGGEARILRSQALKFDEVTLL